MLILSLFQWWYTGGWLTCVRRMSNLFVNLARFFSLTILVKTLFAPWKRTVDYRHPNANLQQRLHMITGNLISRFVGLLIRVTTMFIAIVTLTGVGVIGLVILIVWPLIPVAIIVNMGKGLGL